MESNNYIHHTLYLKKSKDKTFCLSHSISQELCIIRLSFVVHMYKMIISPGVFFIFFKILIFWVVRRVKGKIWPKMKKTVHQALCLRNHTSHDLHLWYT